MDFHEKMGNDLIEAERLVRLADHVSFVTFPVVKDAKLLARALENLHRGIVLIISGILKFEYLYKRINLTKDHSRNLEIFYGKCASRYGLDEGDVKLIKEIFFLAKKHRESGFEFSKFGKVVILDDNYGVFELDSRKMKEFIDLSEKLLANVKKRFSE